MKTFICLLLATLNSQATFAARDTGGGDPMTIEFLAKGQQILQWIKAHPKDVSVSADEVDAHLKQLTKSLDSKETAQLIFTDDELKDEHGVSKAGIFDRDLGTIRVNRKLWSSYNENRLYNLVAIEVLGLSGSESRYEEAMNMTSQLTIGAFRCRYIELHSKNGNSYESVATLDRSVVNSPDEEAFQMNLKYKLGSPVDLKFDVIIGKSEQAQPNTWAPTFQKLVITSGSKILFVEPFHRRIIKDLAYGQMWAAYDNNTKIVTCFVGPLEKMSSEKEIILNAVH